MSERRTAVAVLGDIIEGGAYANLRLKSACEGLPSDGAKRLTALVYTTLDHLYPIDYYIGQFCQSRPKPVIRNVLRLGICELLYMRVPTYAAVNAYADLTKELGKKDLAGFVNAVLRRVDRERDSLPVPEGTAAERLSFTFSYPLWLVQMWIADYGEAFTEALLQSPAGKPEVRAQYPYTAQALAAALPVPSCPGQWDPNCLVLESGLDVAALPLFQEGRMTVQSQSAMLACRALGDMAGKRVLDACAAPGGKSAYIASLSRNQTKLTCWELHEHRLTLLTKTLERLHVQADVLQKDAAVYDPVYQDGFDAVLVDAPCSGLGQAGDKPDIRYQKTDGDIGALADIQKTLLHVCARYVKPGGVLLYATCTVSRRENEEQIHAFLADHPTFQLEEMPLPMENDGMLQLFPHLHGTDGFFMGRLKRCT